MGDQKMRPQSIAEAWGCRGRGGGLPRVVGQLRRGVALSRGVWVLILHSDTVLQAGWALESTAADGSRATVFFPGL